MTCPSDPDERIAVTAAWDPAASATTFTSSICRQLSGSPSRIPSASPNPALFTITWRPPRAAASSTNDRSAEVSLMSKTRYSADPPEPAIVSLDRASGSSERPHIHTCAPSAPRCSATAWPIPLDAPVTTAVRPAMSLLVMSPPGLSATAPNAARRKVYHGRPLPSLRGIWADGAGSWIQQ
jgi:hypothetical protein